MALYHRKFSEIPKDAVVLSESDALNHQWKLINDWTPEKDVWPIKYGFAFLGALSGLSAMLINNHYRQRLRLGIYGRFSMYLPIVVIPTITSCLFHHQLVTTNILLQNQCSVCIEVRSAVIQTILGIAYPVITAPFAGFNFALRYNTYKLPSVVEQPKQVFQLWRRFTKPIHSTLMIGTAIHTIAAMGFTYLEARSYFKMHEKLQNIEMEIDNQ